MITCPKDNCGAENEDGAKFCECCGTPLPQDKECPSCHNRVKLTAKFCAECGFNFNKQQVADKSGSMLSMGDKNVIAGDVIGKQENIKVSGNATIIKNEDESKKVVTCHVCGQNLLVSEAVKCTDCGEITCSKCIDAKLNVCKNCASRIISSKEDIYKQALVRFLEDGKIEISERDELKALQNQLGIGSQRAKELEGVVRGISPINSSSTASNSFGAISPFDMEYYRKAERLFYEDFNYLETLELTEDLYQKYPSDENILTLHLNALAVADRKKAIEIINNLDVDVLGAVLVDIDIALAINTKNSIGSASEKLAKAIRLWSDSALLKCRQIIYLLKTASLLKDESFFSEADGIFDSIGDGKNKLERSWIFKAKLALSQYRGDEVPETTEAFCEEKDFYRSVIVDINEEKGRKFFEQAEKLLDNWGTQEKGFSLLLKSAELNYLPAIRELGNAYNDAKYSIKEKNPEKAMGFFRRGADQDDPKCQIELGGCLIQKKDIAEGLKWVKKAVDQEFPEAELIYAGLYFCGETLEDDDGEMLVILEKDISKGMRFLKKSADHGYGPAQFNLGMVYLTGILPNFGVNGLPGEFCEKDTEKGLKLLKKSAETQHDFQSEAMFELGKIYEKGEIVPKDEAEAKRWYEKAADSGNFAAKKKLAPPEEKKNIVEDDDDFTDAFEKAMAETDDEDDFDDFDEAFEKAMTDDDYGANEPLDVFLEGFDTNKKTTLIRKMREIFGINLSEALSYCRAVPVCILRSVSMLYHSEEIECLRKAGAKLRFEKGNNSCGRNMYDFPLKAEPLPKEKNDESSEALQEKRGDTCNISNENNKNDKKATEFTVTDLFDGIEIKGQESEENPFSDKMATRQEVIEEAVADFFRNLSPSESLYLSPAISAEKEKNLRKKANIPYQESVYALIDCTVFGSAKNGMAFTRQGIWGHNDWSSSKSGPFFCSWKKFVEYDKELALITNYDICFASGFFLETSGCSNRALVLDMLKKLKCHIKKAVLNTSCDIQEDQVKQRDKKEQPAAGVEEKAEIDKIDFMAPLSEIFSTEKNIYVHPQNNGNKKRWNETYGNLKGCFGIENYRIRQYEVLAYIEEPGFFRVADCVVLTLDAVYTKKGVVVKLTEDTKVKYSIVDNAKKLFIDGREVCSFSDVSPWGMERIVKVIETIAAFKKSSPEMWLKLADRYYDSFIQPAFYVALAAANKGCHEAMDSIRKIVMVDSDPFDPVLGHQFTIFSNEALFIKILLKFKDIKDRSLDLDKKEYCNDAAQVIGDFYDAYKKAMIVEAAYNIGVMLEKGWGNVPQVIDIIKKENSPNLESFVYWYKKAADGGFQPAIDLIKQFGEWEKEIVEKAPEELSFAARVYTDKKLGILFNKEYTVLMKYPSSLETSCYSIPDGVTHIAEKAFAECKSLVKVVLPNSVIRIGNYSFSKCESLAEITLSDNLEIIGGEAFSYCKKLEKINLPESLRSITGCAFEGSGLKDIAIPQGIKIIESRTFSCCEQLEKVTVGENVETIGCSAFFKCRKLKNIIWGKKLRYIKREAFKSCSALTHLALPSTVYAPEYHVFEDCKNLVSVMFPDGTGSDHEKALPTGCVPYVVPRNNEYENIVQLYEDAYSGAVESQYQFAAILMAGKGIKQNMREAVKWFSKVAEKGNIQAFLALGYAYSKGNGIAKDLNKAFEFFKKAAEQKNAEAQYELGICFSTGQGVAQDSAKAISYFALAAEQGHKKAKQAEEAEKEKMEKLAEEDAQTVAAAQAEKLVDLILDNCGTNIDEVCKKICEIFQIEYANAKEYTDIAPVYLCQEISLSDAEYVKQNLEAVGAVLRIEPSKQNDITDNSTTEPEALIGIAKVMITNFGSNKVEVIKLIRSYANLGLTGAKQIVDQNQKYFIDFDSWKKAYDAWNELQSAGATVALAGELLSDLSGTIIKFFAEPEKQFNKGDAIAIIESTEGEKSITIPYDCKIIKIGVKQGQQVSAGEGLVIFEYNQQ